MRTPKREYPLFSETPVSFCHRPSLYRSSNLLTKRGGNRFSVRKEPPPARPKTPHVGALIIRIGFWGFLRIAIV